MGSADDQGSLVSLACLIASFSLYGGCSHAGSLDWSTHFDILEYDAPSAQVSTWDCVQPWAPDLEGLDQTSLISCSSAMPPRPAMHSQGQDGSLGPGQDTRTQALWSPQPT